MRFLFIILLVVNFASYGHEDSFETKKYSNLVVTITTQFQDSYHQSIYGSYFPLINDFVKNHDSTETVFISYHEDYCDLANTKTKLLSYQSQLIKAVEKHMVSYYQSYLQDKKGLVIQYSNTKFSLTETLNLIAYGFNHQKELKDKTYESKHKYYLGFLEPSIFNSRLNTDSISVLKESKIIKTLVSEQTPISTLETELSELQIKSYHHNDSINLKIGQNIITVNNIRKTQIDTTNNLIIIQTSKNELKIIDLKTSSEIKTDTLPFNISCIDDISIKSDFNGNEILLEIESYFGDKKEVKIPFKINDNIATKTESLMPLNKYELPIIILIILAATIIVIMYRRKEK